MVLFLLLWQEIYKKGGRKFGFVNLAPLGCLPRTRILKPENKGECMEELTTLANKALSQLLETLEDQLNGFKYSNFDLFNSLIQRMNHPSKYGFKEGKAASCGTGPFRRFPNCGGKGAVKEYQLCDNASEYMYFDSAHPTERANKQFAELMWSGTPKVVAPYNLKVLFENV
ncbi:hypothetical protein HHK36_005943 [Tetracentron sinense]|uniref:GDSL esterase/lipase 1-like n=1 Tax=Tetracentron sinense TaxID=13715 RepID=A0A834ZQZ1_TETSI|nr:hypothetical protein HHK36_005943 [Tetracentron sinense]